MLVATIALTLLALRDASIGRATGTAMLIAYAAYLGSLYRPG